MPFQATAAITEVHHELLSLSKITKKNRKLRRKKRVFVCALQMIPRFLYKATQQVSRGRA